MKKILTFVLLLSCFTSFAQTNDSSATIIFFRRAASSGSAASIKIKDSVGTNIRLYNRSYYVHTCKPGRYKFTVNKKQASTIMTVEAGKTYYCMASIYAGFWSMSYDLEEVDSSKANYAFSRGKFLNMSEPLTRPANRVAVGVDAGFGLSTQAVMQTTEGDDVNFSYGGGFGFGLSAGREVSKHFDIELGYRFMSCGLSPSIDNGSIEFKRHVISFTPSWIIPIDGGYTQRLKLGGGLDVYLGNELDINTAKIPKGFNDTWKYNDAFGFHLRALYEINPSPHWSIFYGLKYYGVNYNFGSGGAYFPIDPFFEKPNGSGINILFGFGYHF